jgi:hypothetical protein
MEFDKLSKAEKIKYWNDLSHDIWQCVSMCADILPNGLANDIREYLDHNELGIALELLADMAIDHELPISRDAKAAILRTFAKMGYEKDEPEQYHSYKEWLNVL